MSDSPLPLDRLVARPELLHRLTQGRTIRLTLIVAPAGYGKTTLLSEWAHGEAQSIHLVWRTLVEADNDPGHLLTGLMSDVRSALPDPTALPVVDETQSSLSYPLSLIFRRAAEITHQDWLLLLDDYHLITNSAIHQALDSLLNLSTWPVHLVIASRTLPPLTSIARFRVEGRLLELDEHDLCFTSAEVADLFEANGLHLKEQELSQVAARTEGWVAALRLICQAAQRDSVRTRGSDLTSILSRMGNESHLFDYLAGQVLNRQSTEVRSFLCRTALLPYLDVDLCNAFLGIGEASAILNALERSHLFITRLAEGPGRRCRYHALFQEFLCRCLEQEEGAQAVRDWHQRAARCFLERLATASKERRTDEYIAAINHLLAAQDWTGAADAIEIVASLLDWGQLTFMETWFDRLPREVMVTRPRLLMALGSLRERQCRWGEALEALTHAERLLRVEGELLERVRALRMQGWIHLRQGRYAEARTLGYQAMAHLLRVPASDLSSANLPDLVEAVLEKSDWSQDATGAQLPPSLLWLQAWTYALLNGCDSETDQVERAEKNLQRTLRLFRQLGDRQWEARTLNAMAMNVYYAQGRLTEALEANQMSLRINEERGSYEVCWPLCGLGQTRWLQGEYESARVTLARLLELAKAHQDHFWQGYALFLSGHLQREQSNRQAARACYEEALRLGQELQEPTILFEPRWGLAMLALDEGDLREAQRHGEVALQQMQAVGYRWWEGRALMVLGLVMDKRGDVSQAEANFCEAVRLFQKLDTHYDLATVYLYLADLCRRNGRDAEALAHLGHCLALSQRYNYDFLFAVRERTHAFPLLTQYLMDETPEVANFSAILLNHLSRVPPPPLDIVTLGKFEVSQRGQSIEKSAWNQRKAGELFRLLLISSGHSLTRDEIIEALWPGKSIAQAQALFHRATSQLRRVLESDLPDKFPSRYLEVDEGRVTLHLPLGTHLDFEEFEQQVCDEHWSEALSIYGGDLCPDDRYADWAVAPRERYAQLYLRVLIVQAQLDFDADDYTHTLDRCRHALTIEPWHEAAVLLAMRAHLAQNDRPNALRLYRTLERTLHDELGLAPMPELLALFQRMMRDE